MKNKLLAFLLPLAIIFSTAYSAKPNVYEESNDGNVALREKRERKNKNELDDFETDGEREFKDYLEPVYGDYLIPEIQTYSSDSEKDQYEDNNSFEKSTNITGQTTIKATLHKDPWYYLFWRDIDEDYYRIDVLGNAKLDIELTNIPYGCDYDLELYMHSNSVDSSFENIVFLNSSSKTGNSDELISRNIVANSYYIRVYPYGEKSYDAENEYTLNVKVSYTAKNDTYANLKYNLGAGGALWLSDFDPFGFKAFSSRIEEYAGFRMYSDGLTADSFANPIFRYLGTDRKIEHATLYIWNNDWKKALHQIVEKIKTEVINQIEEDKKFRAELELKKSVGELIIGLTVTFVVPEGFVSDVIDIMGLISNVGPDFYGQFFMALFPRAWDTTKEEYLDYLDILLTALDTTNTTSDNEIVKIPTYYKITSTYNALTNLISYNCDFTPEYDTTGYKYNDVNFFAFHIDQIFNGTIYGIVNSTDLEDAIDRFYVAPDEINTGGNRNITIGDGIIDELDLGEYHWFNFTALATGYYRFYTEGDTDTYLSIFNQIVPSRSMDGELKCDDDSGSNKNCSLKYKLRENQTIYLRISGYNWTRTGLYHLKVEALENLYDSYDTIKLGDYGFKEKYEFEPITTQHQTENGLDFSTNRLRCGVIDKTYLSLSAKRKDASLAYIEYEFANTIYNVDFNLAIWSEEEYLNKESSISFDYKDSGGKWRRYTYIDIANLSKNKDKLDSFSIEFPEDAYGFRFVVRSNEVNYEKNKGRVVIGDISFMYSNGQLDA